MLTFTFNHFQDLTLEQLYDVLALRETVFNVEQQCAEPDLDHKDKKCIHLLGLEDNHLVAYLRILPKGLAYPDAISFGRVLTAKSARGRGLGKAMMEKTLDYLQTHFPQDAIKISAQLYLEKFYQAYGFETISEPYDEAGITHIKMLRPHDYVKKEK